MFHTFAVMESDYGCRGCMFRSNGRVVCGQPITLNDPDELFCNEHLIRVKEAFTRQVENYERGFQSSE